jgi:hypothetical protein
MEAFLNPHLTFEARIDPDFDGIFSMTFDEGLPYTHKSQYLTWAKLTGSRDSGLRGNEMANTLTGNRGSNLLDGGEGEDTVVFQGPAADYEIESDGQTVIVTDSIDDRDGQDRLESIEWLQFRDGRRAASEASR